MHSSRIHNNLQNAWRITGSAVKIRRFNFFGSLIETFVLSITLIYQIGYVWLDVIHKKSEFFSWLMDTIKYLFTSHRASLIGGGVVVLVLYALVILLIKNVFNAGLIYLIRAYNNKNEKEYRTMAAVTFGWRKSVKLAEYHTLLFWSKPVYIFYIFFWGYRLLGDQWWLVFLMAGIFILALISTKFFFEYARLFIITQDKGVFESLGLSLTMTVENIGITFRLFFSLIIVYFREVVLLISLFLLPLILSGLVALGLAPVFLNGVFILIGLVYLIFLIIVSAINSVIEVFVESLWYSVFCENCGTKISHTADSHTHGHHDSHSSHH